jgi:hypothetical protein
VFADRALAHGEVFFDIQTGVSMDLPTENAMCWKQLLSGQKPSFQTKHAALMFLLKKLQGSAEPVDQRAKALHEFFSKYERVLSAEISQLTH